MKNLSTVLCCVCFAIAGMAIIGIKNRNGPVIVAEPRSAYPLRINPAQLPLDLQLDLGKNKSDTVYITKSDTVTITKTKIRKVPVPKVVEVHDTLLVPRFYIATPVEKKVPSTEIIIVDDVHVIDSTGTDAPMHTGESH